MLYPADFVQPEPEWKQDKLYQYICMTHAFDQGRQICTIWCVKDPNSNIRLLQKQN